MAFGSVGDFGDSTSGFAVGLGYYGGAVFIVLIHRSAHDILSKRNVRSFRASERDG